VLDEPFVLSGRHDGVTFGHEVLCDVAHKH